MHAVPRSTSNFVTVLRATPVMREVERRLLPSTKAATTWIRSLLLSVFIMSIMLERTNVVKHFLSIWPCFFSFSLLFLHMSPVGDYLFWSHITVSLLTEGVSCFRVGKPMLAFFV